ncbi:MAG TPA: DUF4357 domain-containing protein [Syntrophobacter fumaroxidans]|nr:DUF4357 domain-containing protein [Syntrophobacter fumaroxidans]
MTPENNVSDVRQHLEKFIGNAVYDEGARHLDRAFEVVESIQAHGIHRDIVVATNMLRTYIERFLSTCRDICKSRASEAAHIQNLLRCVQSLKENGNLLLEGMVVGVLEAERELKSCISNQELEISFGRIKQNFLSLSAEEQEAALRLLKSLGIGTKRFEVAREKQLERQEILTQNWMKTIFTRMIQGKDDLFLDLFGKRVFEASGHNPDIDKIKNFLASSVQVSITGKEDENLHKPDGIVETGRHGGEWIYKFEILKYGIVAKMVIRSGSYTVLKGSTANGEAKDSLCDNHRYKRQHLISSGLLSLDRRTNLYLFSSDVTFNSPSEASSIVSGTSTNGWKCFNIPR